MSRMLLRSLCLAAAFLPALAGCSSDKIETYEAPFQKQRLLGAIVESGNTNWFFKLMGNADDVISNRDAFRELIRSLRFHADDKEPVTWKLPENWTYEPATGLRYGTMYVPHGQVVTVSRLDARPGSVAMNLNRWRDQLNLPRIEGEGLLKNCEELKLQGGELARIVEIEGGRGVAADTRAALDPMEEGNALAFKAPEGWKELSAAGKIWKAGFRVAENDQTADVTVTPLQGDAGGLVGNVNRWRGQLQLPEATEEQIKKERLTIEVDGKKCDYFELVGPEARDRKRMLVVMCSRGDTTWFIKMMGPNELVAKQKAKFEEFVRSVRFGGGE